MKKIDEYTEEELVYLQNKLLKEYAHFKNKHLHLDMSRGKPSSQQLDRSNGILRVLDSYETEDGIDARNYGVLDGIPEAKRLFSDLLRIPDANIIIGGNSSLNLMYDTMTRFMLFGSLGSTPWCKLPKVKWLCPSPGYDRHFSVTESMGIEMIPVPMTEDGPDMDVVEKLVAKDELIKGMWCVPLYSNPQGICYSAETIDRMCSMETAAEDFRIMWDNAYGVHDIYEKIRLKDIFVTAKKFHHKDRITFSRPPRSPSRAQAWR